MMKNERGITLTALIIYVITFSATLVLLASLSSYIYGNMNTINADKISSEEFNKFNVFFVKDVKESKKGVVNLQTVGDIVITLENGNNYTYKNSEKAIYRNKEKIARNIITFNAESKTENNKSIIEITVSTGKNVENPTFSKTIKYVLKYW